MQSKGQSANSAECRVKCIFQSLLNAESADCRVCRVQILQRAEFVECRVKLRKESLQSAEKSEACRISRVQIKVKSEVFAE